MSAMPEQSELVQDAIRYIRRCQTISHTQLQLEIANVLLAANNEHPQSENLQNSRDSLEKVILALLSQHSSFREAVRSNVTFVEDGFSAPIPRLTAVGTTLGPRFTQQILECLKHPMSTDTSTARIFIISVIIADPDFRQSAINLISCYQNDATLPTAS